jgi:nicotinate-nucleotide adenylyltransferase
MLQTAIFSGTFNPIHIGHMLLANYLREFTDVEEVWLMVSPLSPMKKPGSAVDSRKRLEMVRLAIGEDSALLASDFELTLPEPTYTIRTLTALREQYPERDFCLLIGADNWQVFDKWKDYKTIIDQFPIWIYPRLGFEVNIPVSISSVRLLPAPIVGVSSTFIRDAIATGHVMSRFVPERVWKYIVDNGLYQNR